MNGQQFEYGPAQIALTVVLSLAVYVYYSLTAGRIFAKAGLPAWQGWVPFLNSWRLLQLGGFHGQWLLLILIPAVGMLVYQVIYVIAQYWIGRALGKSGVFLLLAVFLPPVWFGVLAFDRSTWRPQHTTRLPDRRS